MNTIDGLGTSNSLQAVTNLLNNVVNQYIVRPTGAPNLTGVSGFTFDVIDEESLVLRSQITDHYVEDNYAIQDHIAQGPIMFTLRGYVGELTDIIPQTFLSALTSIQSLASIGGLFPTFASQATQVYAKLQGLSAQVTSRINQAVNIYDLFKQSNTTSNKQQSAYNYFYALWATNTLCTVETPFSVFNNMAIEEVRPTQPGQTRFMSDFSITFKQLRIATTEVKSGTINNPDGAGQAPGAVPSNYGLPVASGRVSDMLFPTLALGQTNGLSTLPNGQPVNTQLLKGVFPLTGGQ